MALLQIAEPGQTAAPHEHKFAVGIDLGTTNSLVASVRSGTAETLVDKTGRDILPSVVRYTTDSVVVGDDAAQQAITDPENTISSVKRLMGKALSDIDTARIPNVLVESASGQPLIKTVAGELNPVQVSAEILKALAARATETLAGELNGVVITVPAYFDDAQRQGTKDAANIAGLNVLRLLNEPTAAAIAYGLDAGQEGIIAVYDLGGGTFDISILRLHKGVFEVLATGGDSALGGDDFDHLVVDWICAEAGLVGTQPLAMQRLLLTEAKHAKQALTDSDSIEINIVLEAVNWQGTLNRSTFEGLIQPLVKRTLLACRRSLKDADISKDDVLEVVMVGGSTRVPLVREKVGEFFCARATDKH